MHALTKVQFRSLAYLVVGLFLSTSCNRNSSQTWEDVKTAGRYMQRGVDTLWGKDYESRMLTSDEEFVGPYDDDFIPLNVSDLKGISADAALPQPRGIPGERGIPALSQFYAAPHNFGLVHFETDEHVLKERGDVQAVQQIAAWMKAHPNALLLVEGNADERASASYNMALGMRRANFIRTMLVKQGIDLNRIYTSSHGKEMPIALGHTPEDWKQNRRAEFKIFER